VTGFSREIIIPKRAARIPLGLALSGNHHSQKGSAHPLVTGFSREIIIPTRTTRILWDRLQPGSFCASGCRRIACKPGYFARNS
jgi:hypothetical protein